jgi:hypothetical protein
MQASAQAPCHRFGREYRDANHLSRQLFPARPATTGNAVFAFSWCANQGLRPATVRANRRFEEVGYSAPFALAGKAL